MPKVSMEQHRFFRKLVGDVITYGLNNAQALEYIRIEMASAGYEKTTYDRRRLNTIKTELQNDTTTQKWYGHFARIGFVKLHKQLMENLQKSYNDTLHQLFQEQLKSPRNEGLIIRLKMLEVEQGNQLEEYALGNPIIAGLKAKLDKQIAEKEIAK